MNTYDELLNTLTPEEREEAIRILNEYSQQGVSNTYNDMIYSEYSEIPVTIEDFLYKDQYLGKSLIDKEGRKTVYPYWVDTLKKIFPTNVDTAYNTVALSGAIGLGKSFISVICVLYQLYRMICLKDPYLHYQLQPIDRITFAFINITIDAAEGVAWQKCQELLKNSPWFMEHGSLTRGEDPKWVPPKGIELIYGSQSRHILGRAVFSAFFDEISFIANQDIEKQKEKAKELVNTAAARMQSRFMHGDYNPTLLLLASSKRTEQSYMETFIAGKKKTESKTTLVIDEPQWVIRTDKDSARKFKVAIGNKFLENELVPLNATEQDLKLYRDRGYTLLDVPMGYYENFVDDINIALTDIAGISTSNTSKYIAGNRLAAVKNPELKNIFTKEIITVGDDPEDTAQYMDFIDESRINPVLKSRPLFVHLDMSEGGDVNGIGGVVINGKKPTPEGGNPSKDLFYTEVFHVGVKAPKGHRISFEKNRNFIRWLRDTGWALKSVTADTFQSFDLLQILKGEGFNTSVTSVDRVDTQSRTCLPYLAFKNAIYEKRLELCEGNRLTDEILGLERDSNGKIDHSPNSAVNAKDICDGIAGAVYDASLHAEEFEFEYGSTLDTIVETNDAMDIELQKQQIVLNFEEELKKIHTTNNPNINPNDKVKNNPKKNSFTDFGLGNASLDYNVGYLMNGIIL